MISYPLQIGQENEISREDAIKTMEAGYREV